MTNRVFTDEELQEMGTRTLDLLTEAIESGEKERAKRLATRMYGEFSWMHDLYRDWVAGLMDYIYVGSGDDTLYQALRKIIETSSLESMVEMDKLDFRRRVQAFAYGLRGHLVSIKIEEDDEKVCLKMEPCGSGQRLFETGGYDPPRNLTMLQKPLPMTWGLTDFPIYCTHSPVQEMMSIEKLGYPVTVGYPHEKVARESCRYCIYKNRDDIPEEIYARVGKRKPWND